MGPAVWVSGTDPQICRRSGGPLGLWLLPGVLGYQGTKLECRSKYNLSGWTGALGPLTGVARMSDWWCTSCHPPRMLRSSSWLEFMLPKGAGWWHRDPQVPHRPGSAEHEPSALIPTSFTVSHASCRKRWVPLELWPGPGRVLSWDQPVVRGNSPCALPRSCSSPAQTTSHPSPAASLKIRNHQQKREPVRQTSHRPHVRGRKKQAKNGRGEKTEFPPSVAIEIHGLRKVV